MKTVKAWMIVDVKTNKPWRVDLGTKPHKSSRNSIMSSAWRSAK